MTVLTSPTTKNSLLLAGRLLLSAFLLKTAYDKISAYAFFEKYIAGAGMPAAMLPLDIAFNILAGLAFAIGYRTAEAALLLAGYVTFATVMFHFKLGEQVQYLFFMKNIAILGGVLALAAAGSGRYSLEGRSKML